MHKEKMHAGAAKPIFQNAKELRNNLTHAELLLWLFLRAKPFGYKFRRQHPFSIYILDFYCHPLKLAIEVDGGIHNEEDVKERDEVRQRILEEAGLLVVRFTNDEIISEMKNALFRLEIIIRDRVEVVMNH